MTKPISRFLSSNNKTYIEEAANYLAARGLTTKDVAVVHYVSVNYGHYTKNAEGQSVPLILDGWAYCLKDSSGEIRDNQYLLRVCNAPKQQVYQQYGKKEIQVDLPKFIQTTKHPVIHFCCKAENIYPSPLLMIHEKISSAELAWKTLRAPSVAISGCTGWGKSGKLHAELRELVGALAKDARVVVCFDGDIIGNANIGLSASQLKGAINTLRPDLVVTFPLVPDTTWGVGWDDWAVGMGEGVKDKWLEVLVEDGVEVVDVLPVDYLVSNFGVSYEVTKNAVRLEQTIDNYYRLLRFPRWADYRMDINGDVYNGLERLGDSGALAVEYTRWLERSVCRGYGSKISDKRVKAAIALYLEDKKCSVALEMLRTLPAVGLDEARAAAEWLIVDGLRVVGPMTKAETVETILRMFRDMALRWGLDKNVDVQWVWAIVGPTGCGKSEYPNMLLSALRDVGYERPLNTKFEKVGGRANITEYSRVARDNIVAMVDDYRPGESAAREVENNLYSLTSMRVNSMRKLYVDNSSDQMLHAVYFLTTTDTNRKFLRSNEDSGERRFIPMVVEGHVPFGPRMVGDKAVIEQCGRVLLAWAAHGGGEGVLGSATEYSERYIKDFIQQSAAVASLGERVIRWDWVEEVMLGWYREGTADYRFSLPMLRGLLMMDGKHSQIERADLDQLVERCGAKPVGKARVWVAKDKEVFKDSAWAVPDIRQFITNIQERI